MKEFHGNAYSSQHPTERRQSERNIAENLIMMGGLAWLAEILSRMYVSVSPKCNSRFYLYFAGTLFMLARIG